MNGNKDLCRHMRITISREDAPNIISAFVKKFKPIVYVFGYEDKPNNKHIHGHLEFKSEEDIPKSSTRSDFFKKHKLSGKYYFKELDKEIKNNLLYVVKELDLLQNNLSEDEVEELREMTDAINEDKKKDPKIKLLERIKIKIKAGDMIIGSAQIAREIHNIYVDEWDKLSPPNGLLQQYTLFIMQKLSKDKEVEEHERKYLSDQLDNHFSRFHIKSTEEVDLEKKQLDMITKRLARWCKNS